ncbi:MAG: PASTA domain-containing protein, partial [Candidatus Hydrogenedens sp.]|nr:PASTA domain-containing protein [Candidatus Hydrogenedens sp.]
FSTVEESYSKGLVTNSAPNSGGLIGSNLGNVVRSFWDIETSGYVTSAGGIGKTTEEMLNRTTFEAEGWNFQLVWTNDNNTTYPYLFVTTTVPPVLNIPLEEAKNAIISAGLTVGDITYQCSDSIEFGNVITSDPLPGWEVPIGNSVSLQVSDGICPPPTKLLMSIEELQMIGNSADYPLDGGYELSQDIDASNTAGWNNGQGFTPIGNQYNPFTGYFDGKGFKIKNLIINRPYTDNIGLFGKISGNAIIKNLILEDVSISGKNNVGGLVGACEGGVISNVSVSGTLSGKGNLGGIASFNQNGTILQCLTAVNLNNSQYNSNTGGIVGLNQNIITLCSAVINANITNTPNGVGGIAGTNGGFISYCIGLGSIKGSDNCGGLVGNNAWSVSKCWANVYLDGQNYIGGLIGRNLGGNVNNSFSTGTVKASFYSGGLVGGLIDGTIENCYSIGKVTGISGFIGGLIGYNFGGDTTNSFWNIITSRINISFGGTVKTTTEMLNINTYLSAGWDFTNIWYLPENKALSYPQLRGIEHIEFISIPRIINLNQADATNLLGELGLVSGTITTQCNTAYPAGTVFAQTPEEGNIVAELYPVDMTVSTGPCPTNVPNLIGLILEQAEEQLANGNLVRGNITYQCTNQYPEGTIFSQFPLAGTKVPEGSSVDITISEGPCMTIVPYVIGLTQSLAEYQINTAELAVSVVIECNNEVEPGIVFAQEPVGGTQVVIESVVTIYVSTGPCTEGIIEGIIEGTLEGEGVVEGEGIIEGEGIPEGEGVLEGEGVAEGTIEGEGVIEGEGTIEGEGEAEGEVITHHSADSDGDGKVSLSELLRVIQFFNIQGYHCEEGTEDGYAPYFDGDHTCQPHASDYNPQDWQINLGELLRLVQIFNIGHYYPCPGNSEDGFCF